MIGTKYNPLAEMYHCDTRLVYSVHIIRNRIEIFKDFLNSENKRLILNTGFPTEADPIVLYVNRGRQKLQLIICRPGDSFNLRGKKERIVRKDDVIFIASKWNNKSKSWKTISKDRYDSFCKCFFVENI